MAYIRLARLVLPYMKNQLWGRIINIGGMTARIVAPLRITNGVVNAGVANFTKQLANNVACHNITVNCVHPGMTETERMMQVFEREAKEENVDVNMIRAKRTADIPLGKLIKPVDIASSVLYFCSPLAEMVTGQSIAVDGGSGGAVIY
jgi:NAD(P)-dependent dehydrogenase (short-subunit alcohol dehydrogenase family)